MGQNIGTCITAILSAIGATKNARRTALVHLSFNVIGTVFCLVAFIIINALFTPVILNESATAFGIAVAHSAFNILCTIVLLPAAGLLEKLVIKLVPDGQLPEAVSELDERLMATPTIAIEQCRVIAVDMAYCAMEALNDSLKAIKGFSPALAKAVTENEDKTDHYEDVLSSYLVKLSTLRISASDSRQAAGLLKIIGDFERIADHAKNLMESATELSDKGLVFSAQAQSELDVMYSAVQETMSLAVAAFESLDMYSANMVEPLEQVVDNLKELLRVRHILRLQKGECSIGTGFILSDVLTNLERVSDHCSNIAAVVLDSAQNDMNLHEFVRLSKINNPEYQQKYNNYVLKYALPETV